MIKLTTEEREKLLKMKDFGSKAEIVKDVISAISDSIVERCKSEFSTMPLINYQNIDNRAIFVLQLEMKVARDFKTAIETAILSGKDAEETLSKTTHGGE